jgi:hypothetical protein
MPNADALLTRITATFGAFDIEKQRGGYTLLDRRNGNPIARLRPFPDSDRFELLYWSAMRGSWRTFGNFGRMRLTLDSARQIVDADPMFQIHTAR